MCGLCTFIHLPPTPTKISSPCRKPPISLSLTKSFQAASLGDASLLAIVATIQVLLYVLEELLRQQCRQ